MLQNPDITQFVFCKALDDFFQSNIGEMADTLGCTYTEVERALSAEGSRARAKLFESLAAYCARNHLSIDALISAYSPAPAQPGKTDKDRTL